MKIVLKNFHIIDAETDFCDSLVIENGIISEIINSASGASVSGGNSSIENGAAIIIDGAKLLDKNGTVPQCKSDSGQPEKLPVLMPAFVDLHAHFRDPGAGKNGTSLPDGAPFPAETLESASLAAASGGFGTVVSMANTRPPIDTIEKAAAIKRRCDALGLIDLYPVISLTKNMEGKELSGIADILPNSTYIPLMLSEDGKDLGSDELFLKAMKEAKRIGIPVSCHCDLGSNENNAVRRVIELGKKADCHIHIDHISTKETVETIRQAKAALAPLSGGFKLTCEVMPHNLCLIKEDAVKLGEKTWGRVNPPLSSEGDRQALIEALSDGTIDVIATDHAPHSASDKEAGAPGFSGFETAFAAVYTELVRGGKKSCGADSALTKYIIEHKIDLKKLSSLMSAQPAKLLGLQRGRLLSGYKADLVIIDTETSWTVKPELFKSRGKNPAFVNHQLFGKIIKTFHSGRVVFG